MSKIYPTFNVCKYRKIDNPRNPYPSHNPILIDNIEIKLNPFDAVEVIDDLISHNICCFLYHHITYGIVLYKCIGINEPAVGVGYIEGTEGFYHIIQDPFNPYRFLALARKPPSNIIVLFEYATEGETPISIDLNPPPHDKKSGVYTLTKRGIKLERELPSLEETSSLIFNNEVYYISANRLYKITIDGRLKPYNACREHLSDLRLEITPVGLLIRGEQNNGRSFIDFLEYIK